MIKNIVFDFWWVLNTLGSFKEVLYKFDPNIDYENFMSQYGSAVEKSHVSISEWIYEAMCASSIGKKREDCIDAIISPSEKILNLLPVFRQLGFRLYILSNITPGVLPVFLERQNIAHLFDGVVESCIAWASKPDTAIYHSLLREYSLLPEECLFIDDKPLNLIPAKEFGMEIFHFDSWVNPKDIL